jgi:hypothetical protein
MYSHNAKDSPHKPFLGTRKIVKKEDGKTGKYPIFWLIERALN